MVTNMGTLPPHGIPNTTGTCGSDFSPGPSCAHDKRHPLLLSCPMGLAQLARSHQPRYTVVGSKGLQSGGWHRTGTESQVVQVTPVPWSLHTKQGWAKGDGLPRLWSSLAGCPLQSKERCPVPLIWQLPFYAPLQEGNQT